MENINGKKFWITYATLNAALLIVFASLSPFDYSLILGYFVGIVSFLLFLGSLFMILKTMNNIKEQKNVKNYKFISILIFAVLLILNALLFGFFIWLNTHYHTKFKLNKPIAFFPFNVITMTAPYLLLSIYLIIWVLSALIKSKIKKRKENYGQITKN
ncbi:hypothetical protein DMC14_002390 [Metamycoplasma phocicerebrale]|uniref:Uncharacterized protein n=1 Tax=Metamycoplasma phocicerebrale TaxID=142649 RepID=A0A3T0TU24_9BACT|nr:hypothetical protein [Metamycoplasma phocicerebrale]AZZ65621.1 hypothetical protein DMC14_002390 [Metamycoplasma phocicerebrale]